MTGKADMTLFTNIKFKLRKMSPFAQKETKPDDICKCLLYYIISYYVIKSFNYLNFFNY